MTDDFKLLLNATIQMYVDCIKHATRGFLRNWIVLLASVALCGIFLLSLNLFGRIGMAGGFIIGFISAVLTGQYYSWLSITVDKDRIDLSDLYRINWPMFISVISISFLLFIIYIVTSPMQHGAVGREGILILYLLIVFAFNALPEVTYIRRYESINAFSEALRFTKENWIEWYLPLLILILPFIFIAIDPIAILIQFALISPLLPGVLIISLWSSIFSPKLGLLLGFLLAHWYMLFRGFLYKELESGSRRRRVYLAKQK